MSKASAKRLFSILFLMIFFSKMLISIAPFLVAHFDTKSLNAVIMQLEIESNAKSADIKEIPVKEYLTVTNHSSFVACSILLFDTLSGNDDHVKHLQAFYPSVPTPPPNA